MKNVKAEAPNNISILNDSLKKNGFNIRLEPIPDPKGFGVVTILDRWLKWLYEGEGRSIVTGGKIYPAFRLERGASFYRFEDSSHPHPVVCLQTQSGDEGLALVDKVPELAAAQKTKVYEHKGTIIPEVSINQQPNDKFLLGMYTHDLHGQRWFIQQALQEARFDMNARGARIKTATAVGMMRGVSFDDRSDLIFDSPFYLWITGAEGSELPVAIIYVSRDSWRKAYLKEL